MPHARWQACPISENSTTVVALDAHDAAPVAAQTRDRFLIDLRRLIGCRTFVVRSRH
jgi:hypothetical protein